MPAARFFIGLCLCAGTIPLWTLAAGPAEEQNTARGHYRQAVQFLEKREFSKTVEECQKATRIQPGFTEAYDLWGLALVNLGQLEAAETRFKEALKHNPTYVRSRGNLSFTYYRQKKYDIAAVEARAVLAASPSDPLANLVAGLVAYLKGDPEGAIRFLSKAGPSAERSPEALFALARLHLYRHERAAGLKFVHNISALGHLSKTDQFELGRLYDEYGLQEEAAKLFKDLAQQFPTSYEVRYNLALAYFHQEKIQQATDLLQQLVVQGSRPEAYDLLAACYEQLNKTGDAARAYEKAIELDPSNEDYYLRWGELAMNLMAYEVGIKNLRVAQQRLPGSYRIRLHLGRLYQSHGDFEEAEKSFREAISLDRHYAISWALLAMFFQSREQHKKALQTLQEAIAVNPKDYLLPYVRALILWRSKEKGEELAGEVETWLKRSIAVNPNFVESRYLLGRLYLDRGDVRASRGELEKARELNPLHYGTNLLLYREYRKQGDTTKAAAVLKNLQQHKAGAPSRSRLSTDESILFPASEEP